MAKDALYTKADVRAILYGLLTKFRGFNQRHIDATGPQHKENVCPVCVMHRGRESAIDCALRRFGGRPR
jgi:hypothetical protein